MLSRSHHRVGTLDARCEGLVDHSAVPRAVIDLAYVCPKLSARPWTRISTAGGKGVVFA